MSRRSRGHIRRRSSASHSLLRRGGTALVLNTAPVWEVRGAIYSDRDHRGAVPGAEYNRLLRDYITVKGIKPSDKVTMLLFGIGGLSSMPSFVQHIGDASILHTLQSTDRSPLFSTPRSHSALYRTATEDPSDSRKKLKPITRALMESNSNESSSDAIYPALVRERYQLPLALFSCERQNAGDCLKALALIANKRRRIAALRRETSTAGTSRVGTLLIRRFRKDASSAAKADIRRLREFVRRQRKLLLEQKKLVEKKRSEALKACGQIAEYCERHESQDRAFLDLYEHYNFDRRELNILDRRLKLRHHKMCRQLIHIFPIGCIHGKYGAESHSYRVRSLHIESSIDELLLTAARGGLEEHQSTVAISYIAHLTLLISRYLQIPLRHDVVCRGSRSQIIDCFFEADAQAQKREGRKPKSEPMFPLYSQGVARVRYRKAIELLSENINQLAIQCKVRDYSPTDFVKNIRSVLYSMALARFG